MVKMIIKAQTVHGVGKQKMKTNEGFLVFCYNNIIMQTPHTQETTQATKNYLNIYLFFITNLPFEEHEKQKTKTKENIFLGWRFIFLFHGQYSLYFMGHF